MSSFKINWTILGFTTHKMLYIEDRFFRNLTIYFSKFTILNDTFECNCFENESARRRFTFFCFLLQTNQHETDLKKLYSCLPRNLLIRLYSVYKLDFDLFDYDFSDVLLAAGYEKIQL